VTVDSVRKDVPWDLKIADKVTETDGPTDQEIDFVRRFAPGEALGRKLMYELTITNVFNKAAARQNR
jgi:glutaconate CoA-transferase, subunit B